jgi:hypothetical protein
MIFIKEKEHGSIIPVIQDKTEQKQKARAYRLSAYEGHNLQQFLWMET